MPAAAARLRALLADSQGHRVLDAPGVTDAVTARLAAAAGFEVLYLSGAVVSATRLGVPDLGYVHGTDIATVGRQVTSSVALPLIADADTGYGNALHVMRTAEAYAAAGIAALHVEDQVSPKRCGHMAGKAVIPADEAAAKVRAAVEAGTGIVVIGRTDALSVEGLDAAVERAQRFVDAGADLVFVEGASTDDQLMHVGERLGRFPLLLNVSEAGGPLRRPSDEVLEQAGVRVLIHPVSALLAAAAAAVSAYSSIRAHGTAEAAERLGWSELTDLLDLPAVLEREQRYATGATS